jgi:DNA-binding GntR family transcriptional regulator
MRAQTARPQTAKALPWIKPERNGPVPLQSQIARWLEQLIVTGRLAAGERLPAESVLVERLGVSRVTLRLAMDDLVGRGLVTRSHGRGSFVSTAVVQHDLRSRQGFFDTVLAQAARPEARLLAFEPAVPPAPVAALFALKPGEKAVRFERLYLSAGRRVMVGTSWLTPDASGLSRADIEGMSTAAVHSMLLRHPIASSRHTIGAELAGTIAARRLGINARSAVLVLTRTRFDAQGRVRELNRQTIDPQAYEFTFADEGDAPASGQLRAVAA